MDPWRHGAAWLVGFAPIVYLALSGGGYDVIARSEVGLLACWVILLGALLGTLPRARLSRAAWMAVALLAGLVVWTWIGLAWTSSEERTLLEVARVATYLGFFVAALCVARGETARALLNGVGSAIATIAGLAVLYQLAPSAFPADTGARFFEVARLQWPFEYADAVGEFVAIGLPVLVAMAVSGASRVGRLGAGAGAALAAACLALTASNGAILAAACGLILLALLGPHHAWLGRLQRRRLLGAVLAALALGVGLAVVTGLAHRLLVDFKQPHIGGQISITGSHRYQYWQAAVHAFQSSPWHGIGPGTFQFYWAQHNSLGEFVLNAHSLYFETLAEAGIVGLLLVVGLFAEVLLAGGRRLSGLVGADRLTVAAAVAGVFAFCAAAAFDWVWQIGAIPLLAVLLCAVALNAGWKSEGTTSTVRAPTRVALAMGAALALAAIIVPLSEMVALRNSQAASAVGHYRTALADAATAERLVPGAASARLQQALIFEHLDQPGRALSAAAQARAREALNWRIWLIASRIATEAGHPVWALRDYTRARSLNPTSPLFRETARLLPIGGKPLVALVVPPGKAGANQYFETIPGVAGNFAPPQAGPVDIRFDPRPLATLGLGQAAAAQLSRLSAGGEGAARLAADTAWPPARANGGRLSHGFDPSGSSPLTAIGQTVGGSDAGGLGVALPLLLGGALIGAVPVAGRRRRRSAA